MWRICAIYSTSKRPQGSEFVTRGGASRPIPIASYAARACCGTGPRPTSRPTVVDVGRETRQPIHATSRDRLSSDTLEEMEARLMLRTTRMLIARATVLPRVCAGEARRNTSSVACARYSSGSAACVAVRSSLVGTSSIYSRTIVGGSN